jgi:DNA-binding MarR family transcriptional regulator
MNSQKSMSYVRFLNLIHAIDEPGTNRQLDSIEEQLLDQVILAFSHERQVLVGDLIQLSGIGSQATLHGRIKSLAAKGYVKLVEDATDGRKKNVIPTKLAIKHYDSLSKLLAKALSA